MGVVRRSLVAVEALHIRHIEAEEVHNLAAGDSLRHVAALGQERRTSPRRVAEGEESEGQGSELAGLKFSLMTCGLIEVEQSAIGGASELNEDFRLSGKGWQEFLSLLVM